MTYPVMKIFGVSINWGEFLQGVTINTTTNTVQEARLLCVPLQFQFDPSIAKLSTVTECMSQLTKFYTNIGTFDGQINIYTGYEQLFIDEVSRTQDNVLPYVAVNVAFVVIFCIVSTIESDGSCKLIGATFGLMTIGFALMSGFGLMFYCGGSYNFMVSVTPFIVMCVGIDNDFLLLATWRQTDPLKSSRQRLAESLMEAGPSLTITSLTDVLCFLIGVISGTLSVSMFCLFTALSLTFRFLYQMTFFVAVMILNGRRKEKRLAELKQLGPTIDTAGINKFSLCICPPCGKRSSFIKSQRSEYFMHRIFRQTWAHFIMRRSVRIFSIILMFVYGIFSLWRSIQILINITPDRILSDNSPMIISMKNAEKYIWPYNAVGHIFVLTPPDFRNYSNRVLMVEFVQSIENTKYFTIDPSVGTTFWLRDYLKYLDFVNNGNDADTETLDGINIDSGYLGDFYTQLEPFLVTSENSKFMGDINFKIDKNVQVGEPNIENFQFMAFFQHVSTWDDHVELLLHWRKSCAKFPEFNALVADHTSLNPYLDQRLTLSATVLQTMGIALISMTIVTAIFMPDIIGIFYITLSFLSVDIGVIGFLQVWKCDLDPATLTGILMTIGFSVYYTARICYNYQCADKSMDITGKIAFTMGAVGWPVLQGGLGTVIGITPLAFMTTYTIRTFFKTIVLVVLAGLLHGLLFMPVLLASLDTTTAKGQISRMKKRAVLSTMH